MLASAAAAVLYVHSHGDLYWDSKSRSRAGGFRTDAERCLGAPIVFAIGDFCDAPR